MHAVSYLIHPRSSHLPYLTLQGLHTLLYSRDDEEDEDDDDDDDDDDNDDNGATPAKEALLYHSRRIVGSLRVPSTKLPP